MPPAVGFGRHGCGRVHQPPLGRRWRVAIPVELERRLYFGAALVAICWYLLDRLL
jgi:hypothetical protein